MSDSRRNVCGPIIDGAVFFEVDDGFSVKRTAGGYWLEICIADPSGRIHPDSALDARASKLLETNYARGEHMIREDVSLKILSFAPGRKCPALSVGFKFSQDMELLNFHDPRIEAVWFTGKACHSYSKAARIMDDPSDPDWPNLNLAWRLAQAAGSRSQPPDESVLSGGDASVRKFLSHQLVEKQMILANSALANYAFQRDLPVIYRNFASNGEGNKGWASYGLAPTGHASLGGGPYAQFSSPLRRYVDLVNCRTLACYLENMPLPHPPEILARIVARDNEMEEQGRARQIRATAKNQPRSLTVSFASLLAEALNAKRVRY
jgi:exoribonuclease R